MQIYMYALRVLWHVCGASLKIFVGLSCMYTQGSFPCLYTDILYSYTGPFCYIYRALLYIYKALWLICVEFFLALNPDLGVFWIIIWFAHVYRALLSMHRALLHIYWELFCTCIQVFFPPYTYMHIYMYRARDAMFLVCFGWRNIFNSNFWCADFRQESERFSSNWKYCVTQNIPKTWRLELYTYRCAYMWIFGVQISGKNQKDFQTRSTGLLKIPKCYVLGDGNTTL